MSFGQDSAATPFADPTDTLLGWASKSELTLAEDMAQHAWFPQIGLTDDQLERTERLYGIFLARQIAAGASLAALLEVTPALAVTTLIARAGRLRAVGELGQEYLAGLGLSPSPESTALVTEFAAGRLDGLGLEAPAGASAEEILGLHAGLNTAEVPALLELLDEASPNASGHRDEILAAVSARAADMPMTAASFRLSPAHAAELVDGIEAVRAFSLEHPTSWLDRDRSQLTPRLPRRVDHAVVAELRERPVGTESRASAVGVAPRELRPRLVFDAARSRVCLRLPEQRVAHAPGSRDAEVSWRVTQGGTTRVFRTQRGWGEKDYAEALDVAVEKPVQDVTVADTTNGITWVVNVVPASDPAVIFAANGQYLSDKASLHHSRLTIVAPADARLVDVVAGEDVSVVETGAVHGWQGWNYHVVDSSQAASLQVLRAGQEPSAMFALRSVDPRQRVRFVHPSAPLSGLRTHNRLAVHSESLVAEFPPTLSGTTEIWQLSIAAFAGIGEATEEIAEPEQLEVPAEGGEFAIFDPEAYDAAWVGEYLVRLKGPRNESFRHRFAIIEGLLVEQDVEGGTALRIPAGKGLSAVRGRLRTGAKPVSVEPARPVVGEDQAAIELVAATQEGDQLPVTWSPAALRFQLPTASEPPQWRTSRIFLTGREVADAGALRVRAGGELEQPKVSVRNRHGSPVLTRALSREDALTWSTPTKEIAQAVRVLPQGQIDLEWSDPVVHRRVSVALARISATAHASGVEIDDGALHFSELSDDRPLGVWLWPATAPWAPARKIAQVQPVTPLPEELVGAGDLSVQLFSEDPFTSLRAPERPADVAMMAAQPGYFSDQEPHLSQLSAFFSGSVDTPPAGADVLPIIWDHFGATVRKQEVARRVFQEDPATALQALSNSLVPAHLQPGRMISSGLVALNFGAAGTGRDEDQHRSAWIAALLALGELAVALDEGQQQEAVHILDRLEALAGHRLVETVLTGRDATLDTAVIDSSTVRIAQMNPAQQEQLISMFFANADIVPGPMMADGQRLMAIFETFRRRDELTEIVASEGLIKPAVKLLRAVRGANRGLYAAARVRFDKIEGVNTEQRENAWALAPVISLVFALAARLHAHGMIGKSATLGDALAGWSQLADVVPDLVTGDLLSAEAMVLAAKAAKASS